MKILFEFEYWKSMLKKEFVIKGEGRVIFLEKRYGRLVVMDFRAVEGSWKKFERMKEGKMEGIWWRRGLELRKNFELVEDEFEGEDWNSLGNSCERI